MRKLAVFLVCACILTGCKREQINPDWHRPVVVFFSTKPLSASLLKSTGNESENLITKIIMFGVDDKNNVIQTFPAMGNPPLTGIQLTISRNVKTLYAIANPSAILETAVPINVSDLMALVSDFTIAPQSPLLMSGQANINGYNVNIELIRSVAKIVVSGVNGFDVQSITMKNTPEKGFVFAQASSTVPSNRRVTYPANSNTTVYVAESYKRNPATLTVKGIVQGQSVDVDVSFERNGALVDIVRNTSYSVVIDSSGTSYSIEQDDEEFTEENQKPTPPHRVVAYIEIGAPPVDENGVVTGWGGWLWGNNNMKMNDLDKVDFTKITHALYSFGVLHGTNYTTIAVPNYKDSYHSHPAVKNGILDYVMVDWKNKNPDLKIMLSIMGNTKKAPGNNAMGDFSRMASTQAAREEFADNCLSVINEYGFDGIDIDWEFPLTNRNGVNDVNNYLLLLQEIRAKIGPDKLLSFCVSTWMDSNPSYSIRGKAFHEVVDFVNIMAYDVWPDRGWNAPYNWSVGLLDAFSNSRYHGFTKKQLNLGVPFYSRSSTSSLAYQSYEYMIGTLVGTRGGILDKTKNIEDQWLTNYGIEHRIVMPNDTWLSIETPEMIRAKMQYVKDNGFGGGMIWELSQDYYSTDPAKNNDLLNTIWSNLNGDGLYQSKLWDNQ